MPVWVNQTKPNKKTKIPMKLNPFLFSFLFNEAGEAPDAGGFSAESHDEPMHAGDNDDDFEIDVTGIDTSIPLLEKNSSIRLKLKKADRKPNKDANGFNAVFYFTNDEAAVSTEGVMLPPGTGLIIKYCPLQPNAKKAGDPDYNADRWMTDLAVVIDAIYGTDKDNRPKFNRALLEDMKDAVVEAKIEVESPQEGTTFGPKNIIKSMKFPQA